VKFCPIIALWRRPQVTRLALEQLIQANDLGHEILPVLCTSEDDPADWSHLNLPCASVQHNRIVDKFHAALQLAREQNPDAVLLTGSDNIFATDLWSRWHDYLKRGAHAISLKTIYFWWTKSKTLTRLQRRALPIIGVGMVFSRQLLDSINWNLWPQRTAHGFSGIDHTAWRTVVQNFHQWHHLDEDAFALDIKTKSSVSRALQDEPAPTDTLSLYLEPNVVKSIRELTHDD